MGNQFLANIRNTHAIVHVVRCFDDENIVHVEGSVDPLRDIEVIDTELMLKDLETAEKRLDRVGKQAKGDKSLVPVKAMLERLVVWLGDGKPGRTLSAAIARPRRLMSCVC